jgi:predicted GH43/DUF377 family glycosyl hydrolase
MRNIFLIFSIILLVHTSCNDQKVKNTDYKGEKGLFEWQFPDKNKEVAWENYSYSVKRWWGDFPKDIKVPKNLYESYAWAIGPFTKYEHNPVLEPTPDKWDKGRFGGGVHNGAVVIKDSIFYYVYRGEQPIDVKSKSSIDYICDIGVATSKDGIHFEKDTIHSPFFRKGDCRKYSYEDVNIVVKDGTYYLYCNQWLWENQQDQTQNGTFLATSKDLLNWEVKGIVFPNAKRTHRNGVVLQNPKNEAVKVNGKFIMYLNDGLMAYSEDLIKWESFENSNKWPGGEGCFALCDHADSDLDRIVLFTGGNHTGNFYAIGEVLFSKKDPAKPIEYLPSPVLKANPHYPYENGYTCRAPFKPISSFSDCIFLNGITLHDGKWWVYYGGSEYYTCLATSKYKN